MLILGSCLYPIVPCAPGPFWKDNGRELSLLIFYGNRADVGSRRKVCKHLEVGLML
jgi:hypothetical protein